MRRCITIAVLSFLIGGGVGFLAHRSGGALGFGSAVAGIDPWASPSYRMRYGVLSTFPERAEVVMAGDSLTEVMDWRAAFPGVAIANHGISADTTIGLLGRLDLIERTGARVVAVMIGVNDLQRGEPVDRVASRTLEIVGRLKGKCVLIQSVLPTRRGSELNAKIKSLNASLKASCDDERCTYADIASAIAPEGILPESATVDGLHLTGKAYAKWRDVLKPYLARCSK